jgi:hypothetical protein
MKGLAVLGAGALFVLLPILAIPAAVLFLAAGANDGGDPNNPAPSAEALADIPPLYLDAYRAAGPRCQNLPWTIVAAIGKIETNHGRHGGATTSANGDVAPQILGPSTPYGPAQGPMQFLSSTWDGGAARDGNSDGVADAHNALDAISAAADYLCGDDGVIEDVHDAIWRYNHSEDYIADVLAQAARYAAPIVVAAPGAPAGNIVQVAGISGGVDASIAGNVTALLAAAAEDEVPLSGSGYRDGARQIELRRQHCGSSHYAIYEMRSSQCSPPTARPGASQHERGLAIDFTNCSSRSSRCFAWLAANANRFGLFNLPSEPWHWSTNGR